MTKSVTRLPGFTNSALNLPDLLRRIQVTLINANPGVPKSTKKAQSEAWKKPLTQAMRNRLEEAAALLPRLFSRFTPLEARVLTVAEVETLMGEEQALVAVEVPIKARREQLKKIVHEAMDEALRAQGVETDVEITPFELVAPALGKRFVREGGGRADPTIDMEAFRLLAPAEVIAQVIQSVTIPSYVVPEETFEQVDYEALGTLLQADPDLLSIVSESLILGDPKNTRIMVRDIQEETAE